MQRQRLEVLGEPPARAQPSADPGDDLGAVMVESHGQSDDRGLFDVSTHRKLLDAFGGYAALLADVAARFAAWDAARKQVEALRNAARTAAADADYLRHVVNELSVLAPVKGEEELLAGERAFLMNASRIAEDISAAIGSLSGDRGAEGTLAAALKRLGRMGDEARKAIEGPESSLEQAFALTQEAHRDLNRLLSQVELDSGDLEKKEDRLFALRDAARKYAVPADDLDQFLQDCAAKLDSIDGGGAKLKAAEADEAKARAAYLESAAALSDARKAAAGKLELAARLGKAIPLGWALDEKAEATVDPRVAQKARRLLPLGGTRESGSHKGYGLGILVEILCGVLSGTITALNEVQEPRGHFFGAINVASFRSIDLFKADMDRLIGELKSTPPAHGQERVYVAGEIEFETASERAEQGIPLLSSVVKGLRQVHNSALRLRAAGRERRPERAQALV